MAWKPPTDTAPSWAPPPDAVEAPTIKQVAPGDFQGQAEISPFRQSMEALSPQTTKAARKGGAGGIAWAALKDALSMPLRITAATGAGLGELAGARDATSAGDVFMRTLKSPADATDETSSDALPVVERYAANPQVYAQIAQDPLSLPSMLAMPGAKPITQGVSLALANYLRRGADAATGQGSKDLGISAAEVLPIALGGLGSVGGLKKVGNDLFRKMVKPGKEEVAGLESALDKGKLPDLAGWSATVGGAGEQFLRNLAKEGEVYPGILSDADASGQKVSSFLAAQAAKTAISREMDAGRLVLKPRVADAAAQDVSSTIHVPQGGLSKALQVRKIPANDILPSKAHRIKSAAWEIAFDKATSPNVPKAAKMAAWKAVGKDFREQLGAISPEYAATNAKLAPLYGAEDAMARAASVRGNNHFMNFGDVMGLGIPVLERTPAVARALFEIGKLSEKAGPLVKASIPIAKVPSDKAKVRK